MRLGAALAALLCAVVATATAETSGRSAVGEPAIPTSLHAAARRGPVTFLVRAPEAVGPVRDALEALASVDLAHDVEAFPAFGVVAATGGEAAVATAARVPGVQELRAVREIHLVPSSTGAATWRGEWNLRRVGATAAWRSYAATGDGVTVATIDTGGDWRHPVLRSSYRGRGGVHHYHWADFASAVPAAEPFDDNGHGTQVLGLISGRDGDRVFGTAPGAEWIAVRAFDTRGRTTDLRLLRAAAWLLAPTDLQGRDPRPDRAPDVINGSWVLENGSDPLYADVVAAWRAAGIVPVFAAGNTEDLQVTEASVLAPAAYPLSLAVGASDADGALWPQSARGPGFFGGVKPDLVAPGVRVVTAQAGGGLAYGTGTSMAAPHVAGAAALVLSSRPGLSVADVLNVLRHAATDRPPPGTDPDWGWGELDAARAVVMAAAAGGVAGRVVDVGAAPVPGARIGATLVGGTSGAEPWSTDTGASGAYALALPGGTWEVRIAAFGFLTETLTVWVEPGRTTALDAELAPAPTVPVAGRVMDERDAPVASARVWVLGTDPPAEARTGQDGRFVLALPPGRHTLRFERAERRAAVIPVDVGATPPPPLAIVLPDAPSILVVDADAHAGERVHPYVSRALWRAGFDHDVWTIDHAAALPAAADLDPYDTVLWLHLYGSPGGLGRLTGDDAAIRALRTYVAAGGRLLLSGQDVGIDGADYAPPDVAAFYREVLGARLVFPATTQDRALGAGALAGIDLDLRWPGAHAKGSRYAPDLVAAADGVAAETAFLYPDGQAAGLATSDERGRRLYLAFGLEGAGDGGAVETALDTALGWLHGPASRLSVEPQRIGLGDVAEASLELWGQRVAVATEVGVSAREPLALGAGSGPWRPDGAGGLRWSGTLAPDVPLPLPFQVRLAEPAAGGRPLTVTAAVEIAARTAISTAALWPDAPDLARSRLDVDPSRMPSGGEADVRLVVTNAGPARAEDASAEVSLPPALAAHTDTLTSTSGTASWRGPSSLAWRGAVEAGGSVTVSVSGVLPDAAGADHVVAATLQDGNGLGSRLTARTLVGGPDLATTAVGRPPDRLAPGAAFTLPITLTNSGRVTATVEVRLDLPPGLSVSEAHGVPIASRGGRVAPGSSVPVRFALEVAPDAASGPRTIGVRIDDGALPSAPVTRTVETAVVRPALHASRAFLFPTVARSGDWVTGTVLLANLGSETVPVTVTDSLPPALVLDPATVRASAGTVDISPATVRWHVNAAAPEAEGSWRPVARGGASGGEPVSSGAVDGWRGPVALEMPFPFVTEAVTRAWVTEDGLLALTPPDGPPDPQAGLPPGTVAALWRAGAPAGLPLVSRAGEDVTFDWPGPAGVGFAVTLSPSGAVRLDYDPAVDASGAAVGLRAPDGRRWLVPTDRVAGGGGLAFDPPGGWHRLTLRAQLGAGLEPNSRVARAVQVRAPGFDRLLSAEVLANRLDVHVTTLEAEPGTPVAGAPVRFTLAIAAEGDVDARNVEVRVWPPAAAPAVPGSIAGGLALDEQGGGLSWRGRLAVGERRAFAWTCPAPPDGAVGARLVSRARVRARGIEPIERSGDARVAASDFTGSGKWSSRSVAWPGDEVVFTLRAANSGSETVRGHLVDSLPAGLAFVPGSAWSSSGPPLAWREDARALHWTGDIAPASAVQMRFAARYLGPGRQSNVMSISDGAGTTFSAWADVLAAEDRVFLPALAAGGRWISP